MKDSRLPLLIGMAILALAGVVIALFSLPERTTAPVDAPAPVAEPAQDAGTPANDDAKPAVSGSETARFTEPELDVQQVPETPLIVDSYPPTRHLPLDEWKQLDASAGHFDGVYKTGDRSQVLVRTPVGGNETLFATGWTGDPQLGLQPRDVLISQCGRIVARTRSALERPDVADAVHPNLDHSGWEATLHASDLAVCADPTLQAWAVLPGRPSALLPLNGYHQIGSVTPVAGPDYHVPALPPLNPQDVAPPAVGEIEVTASRVNLRRCAGTRCDRVGQIDGGRHRAFVAEERDGWTLLVFGDRAGWMSDKLFRAAE